MKRTFRLFFTSSRNLIQSEYVHFKDVADTGVGIPLYFRRTRIFGITNLPRSLCQILLHLLVENGLFSSFQRIETGSGADKLKSLVETEIESPGVFTEAYFCPHIHPGLYLKTIANSCIG